MSQTVQQQTCARQLAPQEVTPLHCSTVRFMRADRQWARTPVLYEPSIIIIAGSKRAFLADKMYRYDAQHYLVLSVPLPFSAETEATSAEPLLGLAIRLDAATLARLVTQVAAADIPLAETPASIISTPVNETLADSTLRLLQALSDPLEAQVLGPAR